MQLLNGKMQGCKCSNTMNNLPAGGVNLGPLGTIGITVDNTTAIKLFAVIFAAQLAANYLTKN